MSLVYGNLIAETANALGQGPFTLNGAFSTEYSPWSAKVQVGSKTIYTAKQGDIFEVGWGVLVAADQLTRAYVYDSTDSSGYVDGSPTTRVKVNFDPGTDILIYNDVPAQLFISVDENGVVVDPTPFRGAIFLDTVTDMLAQDGLSDGETMIVTDDETVTGVIRKAGVFKWDAADATLPDGINSFRNDNYATGLHKRIYLRSQASFDGSAKIDASGSVANNNVVGASLKMYANPEATNPNDYFRMFADTAAGAVRMAARLGQVAEKNLFTVYSLGNNADRFEHHDPVVMPSRTNANGLKAKSLVFLTAIGALAFTTADAADNATAAAYKIIPQISAGYFAANVTTIDNLRAIKAAELHTDGDVALVRGQSVAGDVDAFRVTWSSTSSLADDGFKVFRPTAGAAASGNGRWLRETSTIDVQLAASATPSVINGSWFYTQGAAAITNLLNGFEGQTITVSRGDADIVITHDPTKINLGGANITLTTTRPRISLRNIQGIWYITSGKPDNLKVDTSTVGRSGIQRVGDTGFTGTDIYVNAAEGPDAKTWYMGVTLTGNTSIGQGGYRGFGSVAYMLDVASDNAVTAGGGFGVGHFVKHTITGGQGGRLGELIKLEQGSAQTGISNWFMVAHVPQVITYSGNGGFQAPAVSSITVAGTTATMTFASAHGIVVNQIITLSGATPAAFNDSFQVLTVPTTTTLTFAIAGSPGNTTVQPTCRIYRGLYTAANPYSKAVSLGGTPLYISAVAAGEADCITDSHIIALDTLGWLIADSCASQGSRIHSGLLFSAYDDTGDGTTLGTGWRRSISWTDASGRAPTNINSILIGYDKVSNATSLPWKAKGGADFSAWDFDDGSGTGSGFVMKARHLFIGEGLFRLGDNVPTTGYAIIDNFGGADSLNFIIKSKNVLILQPGLGSGNAGAGVQFAGGRANFAESSSTGYTILNNNLAGANVHFIFQAQGDLILQAGLGGSTHYVSINTQCVLNWTLANATDNTSAAAASVPVGGIYRNGLVLQVRTA